MVSLLLSIDDWSTTAELQQNNTQMAWMDEMAMNAVVLLTVCECGANRKTGDQLVAWGGPMKYSAHYEGETIITR
jgi:hypothetical protein